MSYLIDFYPRIVSFFIQDYNLCIKAKNNHLFRLGMKAIFDQFFHKIIKHFHKLFNYKIHGAHEVVGLSLIKEL